MRQTQVSSPPPTQSFTASGPESRNLPIQCQKLFTQFQCPAEKVFQLLSGIKLAKIINKIFFDGNNPNLINKIRLNNENRTANNVVNMNLILKQVKTNKKVELPKDFMQLSSFQLLDEQDKMINFVTWILQAYKKIQQNHNNEEVLENSAGKTPMNQSKPKDRSKENLYSLNIQSQDISNKHIKHQRVNNFMTLSQSAENPIQGRQTLKIHHNGHQNIEHILNHRYQLGKYYQVSHEYSLTPKKTHQVISKSSPVNKKLNKSNEQSDNVFENIYFCHRDISPQRVNLQNIDDSLDKSEKISKKGSFKIVRPKSNFDQKKEGPAIQSQSEKSQDLHSPNKYELNSAEMKDDKTENNLYGKFFTDEKQSSSRKTIIRMADRPPIYRKITKDLTKTQSQIQTKHAENLMNTSQPIEVFSGGQVLQKQCTNSCKEIAQLVRRRATSDKPKQEKQNKKGISFRNMDVRTLNYNSQFIEVGKNGKFMKESSCSNESLIDRKYSQIKVTQQYQNQNQVQSQSKNKRNLFKVQIKQVSPQERIQIMEWLVSINMLTLDAINYSDQFHQICSSGVIFPELVNHHLSRGNKLYYNKNPQRNSEVHANYQRIFDYLKGLPTFQCELMYLYDYFVPQVIESAFWSLLKSCQSCFYKTITRSKNKFFTKDTLIKEKSKNKTDLQYNKKKERSALKGQIIITNQKSNTGSADKSPSQVDYQKMKYGNTNIFKSTVKAPYRHQTPTRKTRKQEQQEAKPTELRKKSSLQFIKELPQSTKYKLEELVQAQQPIQFQPNKSVPGYRQLYQIKKNLQSSSFMNTPQKKNQNITSKSKILCSSVKKLPERPQLPFVTLQMQKVALEYMTHKQYDKCDMMLNLLDHEVRNGVLLNKIIGDQFKTSHRWIAKPKSMLDCKENFTSALLKLRQLQVNVPEGYQYYYQEIIKGKINMFYGVVFYIITSPNCKNRVLNQKSLKNDHVSIIIPTTVTPQLSNEERALEQILFWIRELQQSSQQIAVLHIRDFNTLIANILCHNLLYKLAEILNLSQYKIKPNHDSPVNSVEQMSNMRKILTYLAHNQIIKSEYIGKAKAIVHKDKLTTTHLMKELLNYNNSINKIITDRRVENTSITFSKFARQSSEEFKKSERNSQRLETTMANNSFAATGALKKQAKHLPSEHRRLQVPWMCKMGFGQDLSLNNGVILCHLISKLTMQTLSFNENPSSRAECLTNIRKALKLIDKFNWDEHDILDADHDTTIEIYKFFKDKYKHTYAMKNVL